MDVDNNGNVYLDLTTKTPPQLSVYGGGELFCPVSTRRSDLQGMRRIPVGDGFGKFLLFYFPMPEGWNWYAYSTAASPRGSSGSYNSIATGVPNGTAIRRGGAELDRAVRCTLNYHQP